MRLTKQDALRYAKERANRQRKPMDVLCRLKDDAFKVVPSSPDHNNDPEHVVIVIIKPDSTEGGVRG